MTLLKFVLKIVLSLITLSILLLLVLVLLVKFRSEGYVAGKIKGVITKSELLVRVINLNQPGDARNLYLSEGGSLAVNIYFLEGHEPSLEVGGWVAGIIRDTIGRSVDLSIEQLEEGVNRIYSDDRLSKLRGEYSTSPSSSTPLNIFYLTKYELQESNIGLTAHRDTIFIFSGALNELSEKETVQQDLERSTIMHEWGHLLGYDHVEDPTCVMSEKVEVEDRYNLDFSQIPTEYCLSSLRK